MVIEIPDKVLLKKNAEPELRLTVATTLFHNGWLSLESAIRLSGSTKAAFEKALTRRETNQSSVPNTPTTTMPSGQGNAILADLSKPTKKGFDFEAILEEQEYPGPSKARLEKIVRELDIQEPIDELLAALTR